MKIIPILFSTPMVQALQNGTKTVTRRIIKSRHESGLLQVCRRKSDNAVTSIESLDWDERNCEKDIVPKWKVGDVLWVREGFRKYWVTDPETGEPDLENLVIDYLADKNDPMPMMDGDGFEMFKADGSERMIPWKPSIHMPKTACRTFLKVTDIKVERVQDISEADCIAEGVESIGYEPSIGHGGTILYKNYEDDKKGCWNALESFKSLWFSINGKESWNANPFVWCISFEKTDKPLNFLI